MTVCGCVYCTGCFNFTLADLPSPGQSTQLLPSNPTSQTSSFTIHDISWSLCKRWRTWRKERWVDAPTHTFTGLLRAHTQTQTGVGISTKLPAVIDCFTKTKEGSDPSPKCSVELYLLEWTIQMLDWIILLWWTIHRPYQHYSDD